MAPLAALGLCKYRRTRRLYVNAKYRHSWRPLVKANTEKLDGFALMQIPAPLAAFV
jgi:hypothetical protein